MFDSYLSKPKKTKQAIDLLLDPLIQDITLSYEHGDVARHNLMLNYYVGLATYSNNNNDVSIHMTYKPLKAPYPIGTYFESTIILNDNGVYVFNSNNKPATLYDKNSEALITSCRELVNAIKSEYEHQGKEMVDTPNNDSILVNSRCIKIKSPELQSDYVYASNRIASAIKNDDPIKQDKENTIEKPVTPKKTNH